MRWTALVVYCLAAAGGVQGGGRAQVAARDVRDWDWAVFNDFFTEMLHIPSLGRLVTDVCGQVARAQEAFGGLLGVRARRADAGCADVTVLFARGTCDPGNVGVLVGPPFFNALEGRLRARGRTLGVRGFEYEATVEDFISRTRAPGRDFIWTVRATLDECPHTQLVLSGYSQGCMVVHDAAAFLGPEPMARVAAAVLFGDPYAQWPVPNIDPARVSVVCHPEDNVCEGGDIFWGPHLTYSDDADAAAGFVMAHL
ncbi:hypothetical protein CDD83_11083 [Cordyceps sp. RAO-2017]|nr:hypothetical protein CDD83_11083 [Cordyceps sp. RAO-2017]